MRGRRTGSWSARPPVVHPLWRVMSAPPRVVRSARRAMVRPSKLCGARSSRDDQPSACSTCVEATMRRLVVCGGRAEAWPPICGGGRLRVGGESMGRMHLRVKGPTCGCASGTTDGRAMGVGGVHRSGRASGRPCAGVGAGSWSTGGVHRPARAMHPSHAPSKPPEKRVTPPTRIALPPVVPDAQPQVGPFTLRCIRPIDSPPTRRRPPPHTGGQASARPPHTHPTPHRSLRLICRDRESGSRGR